MKRASKSFLALIVGASLAGLAMPVARATVDDALSAAHELADPFTKQGFTVREDAWGGDLGVKEQKAVTAQLFRGNEYYFWLATDTKGAVVTVHVYDSSGKLAESESKADGTAAWARVSPSRTGTYYAIVTITRSPRERTHWALVYGYK